MPIRYIPSSGPVTPPPPVALELLALRVLLEQAGNRLELGTVASPSPSGSGAVWKILDGSYGFDDPVITPAMQQIPGGYGAVNGGITVPAREVFLPVSVRGVDGTAWRNARNELDEVANPLLGDTTITVTTVNHGSRTIRARRKIDQAAQWGRGTWGPDGWQHLQLLFDAEDPWWRTLGGLDVEPWTQPATRGFFGTAFFPLNVQGAGTFGSDRPLLNSGGVEAQPVYVISTATAVTSTSVTVEHIESGRSWTVDIDGLDGSLTVDTAEKTLTGPDGSSWWNRLAAPFDLWPLPSGAQTVRVTVDGTTAGVTVQQTGDTLHFRAVP